MAQVHSLDADIFYETMGSGPFVVLLHPFPVNRDFWTPISEQLASQYRLILPDLRGHGQSGVGEGPVTMEKHSADLVKVLDDAGVGRAIFVGVSIGGYMLFDFWRRNRERVAGLALCNTKAQADTQEARSARLQAATRVLETGVEPFAEEMLGKVLGQTTRSMRPDLVEGARKMMLKMSAEDVSLVQRGMAERPDSMATLKTISVPTLLVTGDEDMMTGVPEAELMHRNIVNSEIKVISKAGHYSPWEQAGDVGRVLRKFLERVY
jgi:pimeloyl-ACP methyl ester carboxylesterase